MVDFYRGLIGSSDPVCDVLLKNLSTHARSIVVAKATIEIFKGRIRVVDSGRPHEVVRPVGVIGEWGGVRWRIAIRHGTGFEGWARV